MPGSNEGRLRASRRLALLVVLLATAATAALPATALAQSRAHRLADKVIKRLNGIRTAHGLGALRPDAGLARAAAAHSAEMVRDNYFSHQSASGATFDARVHRWVPAGHLGETIAWMSGRVRAGTVVRAWMHSPPHRATLLTASFHRIGVGPASGRLFGRHGMAVTADLAG